MTHRVTMTRNLNLLVLDHKTRMWASHRSFSSLTSHVFSMHFTVTNVYLNVCGPHSRQFKNAVIKHHMIKPVLGKNLKCVRYMSSSKDPPEAGDPFPSINNRENEGTDRRRSNNGLENMFNLVRERSSGFQGIGKQISEKSSSVVTRVAPEIKSSLKTGSTRLKKLEDWNDILNRWYVKYQDFIGITDLKRAQDKVTELSEGLLGTQSRRRNLQAELEDLQEQLNLNHQRITKAELYSEEHYRLFDQARDMNTRLKEVRAEFENCEHLERDTFTQLSAAIRDCHERERTQAEQSKYWSIIASIVSAALASVITSVNNWVRIREIKDHVSANNESLLEGYQKMHEDIVLVVSTGITNATPPAVSTGITNATPPAVSTGITNATPPAVSTGITNATPPAVMGENVNLTATLSKEDTEASPQILASNTDTSAKLSEEDIIVLSKNLEETFREQISAALAKETVLVKETVVPYFDAVFANLKLILEGNQALADSLLVGNLEDKKVSAVEDKIEVIAPSLPGETVEKQEPSRSVVEYSYKHIASAMAVGASIGTLATAFFLGSFSGGATE